jgi:hypothetical protein
MGCPTHNSSCRKKLKYPPIGIYCFIFVENTENTEMCKSIIVFSVITKHMVMFLCFKKDRRYIKM